MGRKSKALKLVDELLKNEVVDEKRPISVDFIDEKTYIEKGCPPGFTTARIAKFRFGMPEYIDVLKEYMVAAYRFSVFAKQTGYPFIANDREWKTVKQEIKEWCSFYKLSDGDLSRVLSICWSEDYKRSKLEALLKFNGVKIPPIDYVYKFVNPEEEKEEPTIEDMVKEILEPKKQHRSKNITETNQISCAHTSYKGLRLPRNGCKNCMKLYESNKAAGVKESRRG